MPIDNPFINLETILNSEKLIEVVFNKAMKAMATGGAKGVSHTELIRRLESKRTEACANLFRERLDNIIKQFPNFDDIEPFYQEMVELLIGKDEVRKILGSLQGSNTQIWKILREHKSRIWNADSREAKKERKAAFSRFASIIMQLTKRLDLLRDLSIKLKKLPALDFQNPIIVIAGYPNVGKSSFLRIITKAKPEIANYPFTSKEVSIGHYHGKDNFKFLICQVIDTPGLLDRPISERNEIEKKALAALKTLPNLIIYLLDPTRADILETQLNLFIELKTEFENIPNILVINKVDLCSSTMLEDLIEEINIIINSKPFAMISALDEESITNLMQKVISEFLLKNVK